MLDALLGDEEAAERGATELDARAIAELTGLEDGSTIIDLANCVADSLIGRKVRIYREPVKPSAYRFMLGDSSEVGIRW